MLNTVVLFDTRDRPKNELRNLFLRMAHIRKLHILGCPRSGTTMLHYAMAAFEGTILHDAETSVWSFPGTKQSVSLFRSHAWRGACSYFVTKEAGCWQEPENFERSIYYVKKYRVALLYIVRDPRDVLTSKHPMHERKFYLEPSIWKASIAAGERLAERLNCMSSVC